MPTALRRLARAAAAAAIALAALPASAQYAYYDPAPPPRLALGGALRVGLDTPGGALYSGERLRDQFGPQVGITGELGVRVTPQLLLGGYLGVGLGEPGPRFDASCDRADCSAVTLRAGFLAQFDFAPWSNVSPWIGYGFGFAAASARGEVPGATFRYSYAGVELGHLMAGVDFRPNGRVGLGLYADWGFGVYRAYHWDEEGATVAEGSLRDPTVHQWFSIGPRISF